MKKDKIFDQPTEVKGEDGSVRTDGPDNVHLNMSPGAALETSDRLFGQAMEARGRKILDDKGIDGPEER